VASLVEETLTDGSKVWDVALHESKIAIQTPALGENLLFILSEALRAHGVQTDLVQVELK
jgi:hypothetical protein